MPDNEMPEAVFAILSNAASADAAGMASEYDTAVLTLASLYHDKSSALGRAQRERDEARVMAGGVEYANRSWTLSVLLAKIDHTELERIVKQLTVDEIDRFIATNNGYKEQIARASTPAPGGKC